MNRRSLVALLGLSLTAVLGGPLHAQSSLPAAGDRAIHFALPSGGGAGLGFRWMLEDNRSLIVDVWASLSEVVREEAVDAQGRVVSLSGEYRWFRGDLSAPVVPFLALDGEFTYRRSNSALDDRRVGSSVVAALGAEWFPLESMSVSGTTGIGLGWEHWFGDEIRFSSVPSLHEFRVFSFRSGLVISFWY